MSSTPEAHRDPSSKRRRPTDPTNSKHFRLRSPSTSKDEVQGEYIAINSTSKQFGILSNDDMPLEARNLPRPHTFVMAKARLGTDGRMKTKLTAIDLTFDEFMVGSLQLASAQGQSP